MKFALPQTADAAKILASILGTANDAARRGADIAFLPATNGATLVAVGTGCEMRLTVSGEFTGDGFSVPGKKLSDILARLKGDSFTIDRQENGDASLRCGRSKFTLPSFGLESFPFTSLDLTDSISFTLKAKEFAESLKRVAVASARDDARIFFNGVLLTASAGKTFLVATNGFRLHVERLKTAEIPDGEFILPINNVDTIIKMMMSRDEILVEASSRNVRFSAEGVQFFSQLVDAKYPNWRGIVPRADDTKDWFSINGEDLITALSDASLIKAAEHKVTLSSHDGSVVVSCLNADSHEEYTAVLEAVLSENAEAAFNASFLIDAMEACGTKDLAVRYTDTNPTARSLVFKNGLTIAVVTGFRV
ncbi:DNA polymerase III subunit beta [Acidithiobacillus ferrivorans]|nr:DNA polymerase III subunit beta [Acidithiobacillus ferrivorans]